MAKLVSAVKVGKVKISEVKEVNKKETASFSVGDRVKIKTRSAYYSSDPKSIERANATLALKQGRYWYLRFDGEKEYKDPNYICNNYICVPTSAIQKITSIYKKGNTLVVTSTVTPFKKGTEVKVLKVIENYCICEDKEKRRWGLEDKHVKIKE